MTSISHLAGAGALVVSFGLLWVPSLRLCALQALLASVTLGMLGWGRGSMQPVIAAVVGFALNAVVLPLGLGRSPDRWTMGARFPGLAVSFAAAVLVVVSVAVSMRLDIGSGGDILALGLSVLLIGTLLVATAPDGALTAPGLLSAQNGLLLAAGAVPDLPLSVLVPVAVPIMPGLILLSLRIRVTAS